MIEIKNIRSSIELLIFFISIKVSKSFVTNNTQMEYHAKNNKLSKNSKPFLRVKLFNKLFCNRIQGLPLLDSQYTTCQPVATIYRTIEPVPSSGSC